MTDVLPQLLLASIGFSFVAMGTWFFSSRRRRFLRTFAPADHIRDALRAMPQKKEAEFRSGMRRVAVIQFAVAGCFWVASVIAFLL